MKNQKKKLRLISLILSSVMLMIILASCSGGYGSMANMNGDMMDMSGENYTEIIENLFV